MASSLEGDVPAALELEHLARLVGGGDLQAELLEYAAYLGHLLGVRLCERPAAQPQAVFQSHAHVAAHHRRHRRDEHLVAAGAEHRPMVRIAEQAARGALHAPRVVSCIATSHAALICGRKRMHIFGSCVGRPSAGSRACRCTIAAPAPAAPIAPSAISSGVTGRCGDMLGVWIAPVTAQVMMTLPWAAAIGIA